MEVILYFTAFIMAIINLVALFVVNTNRSAYYILTFVTIAVSNAGYLAWAVSENLREALLANKFVYFGGCFLPFFLFLAVAALCKVRVPVWWIAFLTGLACVVMGFVFTVGYGNLYYKDVTFAIENGIGVLHKTYGPAHNLYYVLLASCIISMIYVIIYSFFRKKRISYISAAWLAGIAFVLIGVYLVQKLVKSPMDLQPFAYLGAEYILLIMVRKLEMYDVTNSLMQAEETYGYIVFDKNRKFLSANNLAKEFFPELEELRVDYPIPEDNAFFRHSFTLWMDSCDETSKDAINYYSKGEQELRCFVRFIRHGRKNKKIGYLVEIEDNTEQRRYIKLLSNYNNELEAAVTEKTAKLKDTQAKLTLGMADLLENRDSNTGGHIRRSSMGVKILAEELQRHQGKYIISPRFCIKVVRAAPMHDLGKIAVDDRILRKPGKFTPEEFEIMKIHAAKGADIVAGLLDDVEDDKEFVKIAKNVAHYHHEKWNGSGYPEGLSGEDIPLEARMMALADVFDALVSVRCYKEQMSFDEAFKIIEESLGTHFDPELGKIFLQCRGKLEEYYSAIV